MSIADPIPPDPIDPSGITESSKLRAAADGELSIHHPAAEPSPELQQRIIFEQSLRAAVGRSMSSVTAPDALRARILAQLNQGQPASPAEQLRLVRPEEHPKVYRERLPFRRQVWLAAAAALALVVALLFLGPLKPLFGPPTLISIASFTESQHSGCKGLGAAFKSKMTALTEAQAIQTAIEILPKVPSILELHSDDLARAGYRFAGLGRCAVPGRGRSVHIIYTADPTVAPGAPAVSLFVQEDTGELPLATDCSFTNKPTDPAALAACTSCITTWRKDGLIYYLVAPPLPPAVRRAFEAPEEERPIF